MLELASIKSQSNFVIIGEFGLVSVNVNCMGLKLQAFPTKKSALGDGITLIFLISESASLVQLSLSKRFRT